MVCNQQTTTWTNTAHHHKYIIKILDSLVIFLYYQITVQLIFWRGFLLYYSLYSESFKRDSAEKVILFYIRCVSHNKHTKLFLIVQDYFPFTRINWTFILSYLYNTKTTKCLSFSDWYRSNNSSSKSSCLENEKPIQLISSIINSYFA